MKEVFSLLLLAAIIFSVNASNREKLIDAAVEAVKQEHSANKESNYEIKSLKHASKQTIQQGNARIRFENMIHKAERNILENERLEMKDATNLAKAEKIAKILVSKPGSVLTKDEIAKIYEVEACIEPPQVDSCGESSLRSVTGACNNIEKPYLGSSGTPFRRLIPPQYEDSFSSLRGTMQSEENSLLNGEPGPFQPPNPSPRLISLNIVKDLPIFNTSTTHLLMQWGQFVDNDLDLAPTFNKKCDSKCEVTNECVPIRIPSSDPTFGMQGPTREDICLPFSRSIPACDSELAQGKLRPREQINEVTSFLDASQVYGANQVLFDDVKDRTGCLRTGPLIPSDGGDSLPLDDSDLTECMGATNCFLAGDVRVNQHTSLIVMHTLWMREHNRILFELFLDNPGNIRDPDYAEYLFQRARAIVGAEIQKITFKDYLPILLGSAMSSIKPYSEYNCSVDPSIPNAFAAAAFRFGHTQINNVFERLNKSNMPLSIGPLNLLDAFFNPSQYSSSLGTDPILRGLLQRPARGVDEFLNDVLTNHLFQTNTSQGMDLAALNIQRGRDHGLPPYLTWKRWAQHECNLSSDFINDLTEVRLLQTYGTLETVDLWVGGLAETHVPGGLLGATFACIFAKTFEALRDGDRFYYENPNSTLFTNDQQQTIESISFSRIICENADNIDTIQENAFVAASPGNLVVNCTSFDPINIGAFNDFNSNNNMLTLTNIDNRCYLRARMIRKSSATFTTTTRQSNPICSQSLQAQFRQFKTTLTEENIGSTCLPITCPFEDESVRVAVSIDNNQCIPQKSSMLQILERSQSLKGTISNANFENPNNGVYRGLDACIDGTVNEVIFNCQSNEIKTSLVPNTATKSSNSIRIPRIDFNKLPDDVRGFLFENDVSEQSWRKETINTLENLLSTLKAEQDDKQENENKYGSDQELFNSLSAFLNNKS